MVSAKLGANQEMLEMQQGQVHLKVLTFLSNTIVCLSIDSSRQPYWPGGQKLVRKKQGDGEAVAQQLVAMEENVTNLLAQQAEQKKKEVRLIVQQHTPKRGRGKKRKQVEQNVTAVSSDDEFHVSTDRNSSYEYFTHTNQCSERRKLAKSIFFFKKNVRCSHCGKLFGSRSAYSQHYKIVVQREEQRACPVCQETMATWYNMKRHLQNLHGWDSQKIGMLFTSDEQKTVLMSAKYSLKALIYAAEEREKIMTASAASGGIPDITTPPLLKRVRASHRARTPNESSEGQADGIGEEGSISEDPFCYGEEDGDEDEEEDELAEESHLQVAEDDQRLQVPGDGSEAPPSSNALPTEIAPTNWPRRLRAQLERLSALYEREQEIKRRKVLMSQLKKKETRLKEQELELQAKCQELELKEQQLALRERELEQKASAQEARLRLREEEVELRERQAQLKINEADLELRRKRTDIDEMKKITASAAAVDTSLFV